MKSFILILFGMLIMDPTAAFAKKSRRQGFNFGTSLYANSGTEPSIAGSNTSGQKTLDFSASRYQPYFGYSFSGLINVGLGLVSEKEFRQSSLATSPDAERYLVNETKELQGAFLFSKLLFGKYFFMDLSLGYYERKLNKSSQVERETSSGFFSGQRETFNLAARGSGYQAGLGLEAPISEGFHFTAAYYNRILAMYTKSEPNKGILYSGKESSSLFNMGLAYYFN